ncbi:MAG TPA: substrate-binding domain-containing protein [Tepidisphaeraceae bacterium]
MPSATKELRIAVLLNPADYAARPMLAGILEVARIKHWRLTADPTAADGILHAGPAPPSARVPLVSVSADPFANAMIGPDAAAVGRMAAEHFLDRGFRRFVYSGPLTDVHPDACGDAFADCIRRRGHACAVMHDPLQALALPRPIACFVTGGVAAVRWVAAVRSAGRTVPGDVAVLTVGDDELTCERTDPPLSAIDVGPRTLGRLAARRLVAVLRRRAGGDVERVPPVGVTLRASTDTLAVADADVAAAVRFVREHAGGPLRVTDILRAVDLDRRTLERRFQKSLGRSPAEVLRRCRVERAADLLRNTPRPISDVATAVGFRLPQHLAVAFKALRGQTPRAYRAAVRGEG